MLKMVFGRRRFFEWVVGGLVVLSGASVYGVVIRDGWVLRVSDLRQE